MHYLLNYRIQSTVFLIIHSSFNQTIFSFSLYISIYPPVGNTLLLSVNREVYAYNLNPYTASFFGGGRLWRGDTFRLYEREYNFSDPQQEVDKNIVSDPVFLFWKYPFIFPVIQELRSTIHLEEGLHRAAWHRILEKIRNIQIILSWQLRQDFYLLDEVVANGGVQPINVEV